MKSLRALKLATKRRLWKFAFKYARFGKRSCIYKPIFVAGKKNIYIGNNVQIMEHSRIEVLDKWGNQILTPKLVIGDNTSFEQHLHMTCGESITIGRECTFSSRVLITDIDHDYSKINTKVSYQPLITKSVKIGDYCFVGMDVKIFPGVNIGDNVIVGANSIVMSDLPSYTVCVGIPAKPIKRYNFEKKIWEKF